MFAKSYKQTTLTGKEWCYGQFFPQSAFPPRKEWVGPFFPQGKMLILVWSILSLGKNAKFGLVHSFPKEKCQF